MAGMIIGAVRRQLLHGLQVEPAPVLRGLQVEPAPVLPGLQVQPAPVARVGGSGAVSGIADYPEVNDDKRVFQELRNGGNDKRYDNGSTLSFPP